MADYLSIARNALPHPGGKKRPEHLEDVIKGTAIELWSDSAGSLFIVADEDDARLVGQPRGSVHTLAEVRMEIQIGDPAIVREVHDWKRAFNGRISGIQRRESRNGLTNQGRDDDAAVTT